MAYRFMTKLALSLSLSLCVITFKCRGKGWKALVSQFNRYIGCAKALHEHLIGTLHYDHIPPLTKRTMKLFVEQSV